MSQVTYLQYDYQPEDDYVDESMPMDGYGFSTSPSSFGRGGHSMTPTNSSQSTSSYTTSPSYTASPSYTTSPSYTASPSSREWHVQHQQQQPSQYPTYNSLSSTPEAYLPGRTEDPAYPPQTQYYQPAHQPQPAQERPRSQRSTTESAPIAALVCLVPGCLTRGCFKRRADLTRHMDTVHDVKRWWDCPRPRCDRKADRGFTRRDHLYEHLRNKHGVEVPTGGSERRGSRRRGETAGA